MVPVLAKVSVVPSVIPKILNRLVGSIRCCGVIFVFLNSLFGSIRCCGIILMFFNKDMSEPESMMNEHSEFIIASRNLIKFVGPRFTEYIETGSVGDLKNYFVSFVA